MIPLLRQGLPTPFGEVSVVITGDLASAKIEARDVECRLPPDVSVDGWSRFDVLLRKQSAGGSAELRVSFAADASPESGEWLESVQFNLPSGRLGIGLRDHDWFKNDASLAVDHAEYFPDGLKLQLRLKAEEASLPLSLAWLLRNPATDAERIATWFAVDAALPQP